MKNLSFAAICLFALSGFGADWKARLPRPVFDEKPELVELYVRTWEIAHARIDSLPGIPVPRYMDEGHRSDWIWIWDTCFMVHFCKYFPEEFPGVDSLGNFYGILMAGEKVALPKVRGNRWSCGPKGLSQPWEGRMLDFKVHNPENPPLFAAYDLGMLFAYGAQPFNLRQERCVCARQFLRMVGTGTDFAFY
jgi:hypothetical protein